MLITLDAIAEFLSSPSNGDVFIITRLADDQWDVAMKGFIRCPARSDRAVIDLTASSDEEAEASSNNEAEKVAEASSDEEAEDVEGTKGGDSVVNNQQNIIASETSSAESAVEIDDDDDDSVDYGLSQDFSYMAEIMGDE